jgi:hypothetical protein
LVPAKPAPPGPQADPQAAVRRDYELALQLATRDAWEAFLSQYPDGFYSNLAKGQLNKIVAEEGRAVAAEKARLAEQERARLVEQGARQAELAKAIATAKAAEEARVAAEEANRVAKEKAATEEKARLAEEEKAKGIHDDKVVTAGQAGALSEKAAVEKREPQLAALSPPSEHIQLDLPRALRDELRRVGCNTGPVFGDWNEGLYRFNVYAGTRFDPRVASLDALDAVKGKTGRICPFACALGYRADDDRCVKMSPTVRVKRAVGKPDQPKPNREPAQGARVDAVPPKPQAAAKIFCDTQGCRPLGKGCRIEAGWVAGAKNRNSQYQVCP